jgi:Tol biopolymer transport system component
MPGGTDAWPAWSPSGEYIAFTRQPFAGGNPQGYLMKRDGSNVVRVAESLDYVRIMDWQPR